MLLVHQPVPIPSSGLVQGLGSPEGEDVGYQEGVRAEAPKGPVWGRKSNTKAGCARVTNWGKMWDIRKVCGRKHPRVLFGGERATEVGLTFLSNTKAGCARVTNWQQLRCCLDRCFTCFS